MEQLQFDRADFGEAATADTLQCTICKESITGVYYEINGEVVCENCQAQALALRTGGSAAGRFLRATIFGTLAGAAGAGIYYGILALTGYEFGLIAILVGFMVGFAVSFGSHQRGGWLYQLLAVGLTYCSIVSAYIPPIAEELRQLSKEELAEEPVAEDGSAPGELPPAGGEPGGLFAEEALEEEALEPPNAAEPMAPPPEELPAEEGFEVTEFPAVFFWILVVIFALVAPFLGGFENILGILIIGFGLWQAWQLNRKRPFEVSGPFQVAGAGG